MVNRRDERVFGEVMRNPKILFFGNERLATGVNTEPIVLQALIDAGYDVAAIVSNYEVGKSRNTRPLEIQDVASKHKIPLLLPPKLDKTVADQLKSYNASVAVLVAYGNLVPEHLLNIFPRGIVNIHPSLLPLHRGSTPIESVILDGDKKTGVSLMQLVQQMDAGPIYGQSELPLVGTESKQELADSLLEIGKSMLIELLPGILSGQLAALPQDENHATYDRLLEKADGKIDWTKPAELLEREVRAFNNWPKSSTKIAGIDVVITKAKCVRLSGKPGEIAIKTKKSLAIYCGKDALEILEIVPVAKKTMPIEAFMAGYGNKIVKSV